MTKNAEKDRYGYSSYDLRSDARSAFLFSNGKRLGKIAINVIKYYNTIFATDNSTSVNNTAIKSEAWYWLLTSSKQKNILF